MNRTTCVPPAVASSLVLSLFVLVADNAPAFAETTETTQWTPYLEWTLEKQAHRGNPYDIRATVTFIHTDTGDRHVTETFYDGGETWRFRFTGTRIGEWTFETASADPDLDGKTGTALIRPHPNPRQRGFVTHFDGSTWGWQGTGEAFVPQLAMYKTPNRFYNRPDEIDADIQEFLVEHGFTGLHVPSIAGRWFNVEASNDRVETSMTRPDPRTFEALETLITKVHTAGGMVHIWAWGDHSRHQTPRDLAGGINGPVDQRLQRYIAARLGPIPGWTMGYGFDLWEWVDGEQLTQWHAFMHDRLGWFHFLGARASKNTLEQLSEAMDYSGYEQHRPDYAKYVETIQKRPDKPSFSEDRFRLRNEGREKDYTPEETRRGLWHSTMAGGVANIWGNLLDNGGTRDSELGSAPYPNKDHIKTHFVFFKDHGRFVRGMERAASPGRGQNTRVLWYGHMACVFYREDATSIQIDLSEMAGPVRAVAVDAKKPYEEIDIGPLTAAAHMWQAPYRSDWAIAVGTWRPATVAGWQQLAALATHWLATDCSAPDWCDGADPDRSGFVDITDFALLARNWSSRVHIPGPAPADKTGAFPGIAAHTGWDTSRWPSPDWRLPVHSLSPKHPRKSAARCVR